MGEENIQVYNNSCFLTLDGVFLYFQYHLVWCWMICQGLSSRFLYITGGFFVSQALWILVVMVHLLLLLRHLSHCRTLAAVSEIPSSSALPATIQLCNFSFCYCIQFVKCEYRYQKPTERSLMSMSCAMRCVMRCVIHVLFAELTMSSRVAAKLSMFGVLLLSSLLVTSSLWKWTLRCHGLHKVPTRIWMPVQSWVF